MTSTKKSSTSKAPQGKSKAKTAASQQPAATETDWEQALAEQEASGTAAEEQVFKPLETGAEESSRPSRDLEMVMDIPVKLNVILGRTRITIKQLLELTEGSLVELDGLAGDPLDILINDYLIAQGEVVVVNDKYGIRITEIINPSERIHKLNR